MRDVGAGIATAIIFGDVGRVGRSLCAEVCLSAVLAGRCRDSPRSCLVFTLTRRGRWSGLHFIRVRTDIGYSQTHIAIRQLPEQRFYRRFEMARRKRVQVDELIWLIHKEVLARVGSSRQLSFSVGRENGSTWAVRLPTGGRPLHPTVARALKDVEHEFQQKYAIPLNLLRFPDKGATASARKVAVQVKR